jgi:hypothetical protein
MSKPRKQSKRMIDLCEKLAITEVKISRLWSRLTRTVHAMERLDRQQDRIEKQIAKENDTPALNGQ